MDLFKRIDHPKTRSKNNPENTIWAKLISLCPNKENILFYTKPNEPNEYSTNLEWRIYQNTIGGQIWIVNLSTTYIRVEDTWLEKNEEKQLLGGEMIAFSQEKITTDANYNYVFCVVNSNSNSNYELKRSHDRNQEMTKFIKLHSEIQEELICAICMKAISDCTTLNPCWHSFCADCVWRIRNSSAECPLCRKKIKSSKKNPLLHKIVELTLQASQSMGEEAILYLNNLMKRSRGSSLSSKRDQKKEMRYEDGSVYKGGWKDGKREGEGTLTLKDGCAYQGKWVDDYLPTGQISYPDKKVYEGEIKDLQRHGKGFFVYAGLWTNDVSHGKGRESRLFPLIYYDGNWEYGVKCGYGEMHYYSGSGYKGDWKDNKRHGSGTYVWDSGNVYEGEWENGRRSGKGTQRCPGGDEYSGSWVEDIWCGEGIFQKKDGTKYTGTWTRNGLEKNGLVEYPNGDKYSGQIQPWGYEKQGHGVMIYENGDEYDGSWENDQENGCGKYTWKEDQSVYDGEWKNGEMCGRGIVTYADGTQIEGMWENGELIENIILPKIEE